MPGQYNPRVTPWAIQESDFPADAGPLAQARFLLNYAILAPSGHNTQPWKFQPGPGSPCLIAYADYSRRLPVVDPGDRELLISVGAALYNFRVAAAYFGRSCIVTPVPGGAVAGDHSGPCVPVASVTLHDDPPDPGLAELFPAILRRRTNRLPYETRPLTPAHRARIMALAHGSDAGPGLRLIEDMGQRSRLAALVAAGDRSQMANSAFRNELAGWVRPNAAGQGDGVAGDGLGIPDLISWGGSWFIRSLDLGSFQARRNLRLAQEAPALALVYGPDSLADLLAAGELLQSLLLTLTCLDIQHGYLNQPIQTPTLRGELRQAAGLPDQPQILLRIGYGPTLTRAMPRRPLAQVLI